MSDRRLSLRVLKYRDRRRCWCWWLASGRCGTGTLKNGDDRGIRHWIGVRTAIDVNEAVRQTVFHRVPPSPLATAEECDVLAIDRGEGDTEHGWLIGEPSLSIDYVASIRIWTWADTSKCECEPDSIMMIVDHDALICANKANGPPLDTYEFVFARLMR